MTTPFTRGIVLITAITLLGSTLGAQSREDYRSHLWFEVDGEEPASLEEVAFYGPRVPRVHYYDATRISERDFFRIAGDAEAERLSRNHRIINMTIGLTAVTMFFGGLLLFGASDDIDFTTLGLPESTNGRIVSFYLVGGSVVPAVAAMVRRPFWAPLDYTYRAIHAGEE